MNEKKENEKIMKTSNGNHIDDDSQSEDSTPTGEDNIEDASPESTTNSRRKLLWAIPLTLLALIVIAGLGWSMFRKPAEKPKSDSAREREPSPSEAGKEVKLEPEALASAGLEIEGVTSRPAIALLDVTGTVENNPQQTQAVSPLVSGRIQAVFVSIGDRVVEGQKLATIASTEITEALGKLHEAENRLDIARKNHERVRRSENRVGILQSKARLDETEATLKRTEKLIELGAGAGKDLIAANAAYQSAKADYDFQRNITLNKEIQEAEAEVKTTEIDVKHQQQSLLSLGVNIRPDDENVKNIALVPVRATLAGVVTERTISAGAGVQAGQQMFMVSNISNVWITANVPQGQLGLINIGSMATVTTTALGSQKINARVTYIDPGINEDTRTAKVRLAVDNPGERLRAGMFNQIGFQTGTSSETGKELVVRSGAVQRIGEKTIVFVPKDGEIGAFEVREVETGGEVNGYTRIKSGLTIGDKVVTKGSFTLKTQLQKGELGEE